MLTDTDPVEEAVVTEETDIVMMTTETVIVIKALCCCLLFLLLSSIKRSVASKTQSKRFCWEEPQGSLAPTQQYHTRDEGSKTLQWQNTNWPYFANAEKTPQYHQTRAFCEAEKHKWNSKQSTPFRCASPYEGIKFFVFMSLIALRIVTQDRSLLLTSRNKKKPKGLFVYRIRDSVANRLRKEEEALKTTMEQAKSEGKVELVQPAEKPLEENPLVCALLHCIFRFEVLT
jgi:hypothetical protein